MRVQRRDPKQLRSRQTVEAVLDAVVRVLKREGAAAVTTNRIAEVAGVSIGSVYQYFPNKRAIYTALHDRHSDEMSRLVERTLVEHAGSSLEVLLRALVEAMIEAHATDPALHELLREVPHDDGVRDLPTRLRGALRLAMASRRTRNARELERRLFVLTHMIDALSHAAVNHRPSTLSLGAAKEEAVRAVLAYVRA